MTRDQIINHLSVHGWVPVAAKCAAIARGQERVFITRSSAATYAGYYVHPTPVRRVETEWCAIEDRYLQLMHERINEGLGTQDAEMLHRAAPGVEGWIHEPR